MDKRKLQIFKMVADHGSFSQAGEELHIAQSAVSVAIKKLENELGLMLFDRQDRKIKITVEGQRLLKHCNTILQQFEQATSEMAALMQRQAGEVRFSTPAMLGQYFFPDIIHQFSQLNPNIQFRIANEGTVGVQAMLDAGEIDMGVVNDNMTLPDMNKVLLSEEEVVVCVAKNHPLANVSSISVAQFCEQRLILYRQDYYLRELAISLHEKMATIPNIVIQTDLLGVILSAVKQSQGVTLALKMATDAEDELIGIPFTEKQSLSLSLGWPCNRQLSLANQAFIEYLQTQEQSLINAQLMSNLK